MSLESAKSPQMKVDLHKNGTVTVVLVLLLLILIYNAGRCGVASLLTAQAAIANQVDPVDTAIRLNGGNADAHSVRAAILEPNDPAAASNEHYKAAMARPDDYVLWLNLARSRELEGDSAQAIAAARQAVTLAPAYAMPHYQLGNILLRAGQQDEAFKELALAAASNPTLLSGVIDLAWQVSQGNVSYVEQVMSPKTPLMYRGLGDYFRQKNEVSAAIAMYAAAGGDATEERRSFVGELINAGRFKEAATLWGIEHSTKLNPGVMFDPGFEQESDLTGGFGWTRDQDSSGVRLSLDSNNPREGKSSLKVEFDGSSNPLVKTISQYVLVEPRTRYQLRFSVRSEELVSGGLPRIIVTDPNAKKVVAQSGTFPKTTNGWRDYQLEFATEASAEAIQIALQRETCEGSNCPIFGRVWLDNFSLQKR